MIEFVFAGAMLTAYPLENLLELPNSIRIAQHYENINPYECIRIIDNNLPKLYEVIKEVDDNPQKKSDASRNVIFALLTKQSCQITADKLEDAQQTSDLIKEYKLPKTNFNNEIFIYNYNLNRIGMLEEKSNFSFNNLNINKNTLNENNNYIIAQELTKKNITKEYINSILSYRIITKTLENRSIPINLLANIYINGYVIYSLSENYTEALSLLDSAIEILQTPNYTYTQAKIAREAARIYEEYEIYEKAIIYQEIYIKAVETIPEELSNYIEGLNTLANMYLKAGNKSHAYMLIIKAENLLRTIKNNDLLLANLRLLVGETFYSINNHTKSLRLLTAANESFNKLDNAEGILKSSLALAKVYVAHGQLYLAQNILSDLSQSEKITMNLLQKDEYEIIKANLLAKKNNYKEAYTKLSELIKNKVYLPGNHTKNLTENEIYDKLILKHKINSTDINSFSINANDSIQTVAWSLALVILLFMQLIILRLHNSNKKLRRKNEDEDENRKYTAAIILANEQDFLSHLRDLGTDFSNKTEKELQNFIPHEKEIYHVYIPGITNLNISVGNAHANQLYNIFRERVKDLISSKNGLVFELAYGRFIILRDIQSEITTDASCNYFITAIQSILSEIRIHSRICIGTIEYPFLLKNPLGLDSRKILEISLIALNGAIHVSNTENSWLRLSTNSMEKNFLVNGDIRQSTLEAFRKNLIRVISSHDKTIIDWNLLLDRNVY